MRTILSLLSTLVLVAGSGLQACRAQTDPYDSGGPLLPEQASYDVLFYDLALRVEPADSSIAGTLTATARVTSPVEWFVLDLDPRLAVESVVLAEGDAPQERPFERRGGKLWIDLPTTRQPGDEVTVAVTYGGKPRVAPRPPWDGGFTWARTADGSPWIATSCQGEGADIWWPVKDHPSDEPDSMAIHVTVPEPLVVASNGRLQRTETHGDGTRTFHWFVSTPINTYTVALNIAPYRTIERTYRSVAGDELPVVFYVLPEDYERGERLFEEILDHMRFYEDLLGPYPFRADKYGVAQTPHLGMEHQTIIAYGARFDNGAMTGGIDWGFDALHHHEFGHEWFGNLVTNADWSDMWLHEGFDIYTQALYIEQRQGMDRAQAFMNHIRNAIRNDRPVAPRGANPGSAISGDIYYKGAWVLHTLRYLIGDEALLTSLRRMAYPTPELEQVTDGSQCRFATTDDYLHLVEQLSGKKLDWLFEVYLRRTELPRLVAERDGDALDLRWETPDDLPFPMPVDVRVGNEVRRVEMPDGRARISVPGGAEVQIDPMNRVLKATR